MYDPDSTTHVIICADFSIVFWLIRAAVLATDGLTLVLTWIKTFRHWKQTRQLNIPVTVTTCLVRDGKSRLCMCVFGLTRVTFVGTLYFL